MAAIRAASPQARPPLHPGFDQVNQLGLGQRSRTPISGFMARLLMALCSLPRTNPGDRLQYKSAVNGPVHAGIMTCRNRKLQAALRHPAAPVDGLALDRSGTKPKVARD